MDLSMFYTADPETGEQAESQRPETKSWPDAEQCIKHNHGQPCTTIDSFIEMASDGEQWDWFDSYKDWQAECERLTALNDERVPDEETGELPEPYPLPDMPERPPLVDLAQWKLDNYALLRREAYGPVEQQLDKVFHSVDDWINMQKDVKALWPKNAA